MNNNNINIDLLYTKKVIKKNGIAEVITMKLIDCIDKDKDEVCKNAEKYMNLYETLNDEEKMNYFECDINKVKEIESTLEENIKKRISNSIALGYFNEKDELVGIIMSTLDPDSEKDDIVKKQKIIENSSLSKLDDIDNIYLIEQRAYLVHKDYRGLGLIVDLQHGLRTIIKKLIDEGIKNLNDKEKSLEVVYNRIKENKKEQLKEHIENLGIKNKKIYMFSTACSKNIPSITSSVKSNMKITGYDSEKDLIITTKPLYSDEINNNENLLDRISKVCKEVKIGKTKELI